MKPYVGPSTPSILSHKQRHYVCWCAFRVLQNIAAVRVHAIAEKEEKEKKNE